MFVEVLVELGFRLVQGGEEVGWVNGYRRYMGVEVDELRFRTRLASFSTAPEESFDP